MTRTPRLRLFGWLLLVTSLMLASCTQQNRPQPVSTESNTRAALVTDLDVDNARVASGSGVEQILSAPTSRGGFQESNELGALGFSASLSSVTDSGFLAFIRHTPSAPDPWELLLLEDEVAGPVTVYAGDREIQSTAVSLAGEYVVFSMMDAPTGGDFQVYRLDVPSLTLEQLTSDTAENTNVSITADGSTIVWEADSPSSTRGVVIREYAGANYNQLTLNGPVDLVEPSISADGKWLALIYTFAANDLAASLYSVDTDSLQFVDDGSPAVRRSPSVSRNGASVLWLEPGSSTGNSVKLATTSTSIVAEVLNAPDPVEHPFLSAPGNHFAYISTVSGDSNVYIHDIAANTSSQWSSAPSGSVSYGVYWQFSPTVTAECSDLVGSPTSSVASAIPDCEFYARDGDYAYGRPGVENVPISFNTLLIAFDASVTVQQADALLTSISAEIVGGISGAAWEAEGVLIVRVPLSTHAEMISLVASLEANPIVDVASPDVLLGSLAVPQQHWNLPNTATELSNWTWQSTAPSIVDGNYGHKIARIPQLWNLNAALESRAAVAPIVGILDNGFTMSHPDLQFIQPYAGVAENHGTQVAGIIGATYNNVNSGGGVGIDGVNPFARMLPVAYSRVMVTPPVYEARASTFEAILTDLRFLVQAAPQMRIANISLGYNWHEEVVNSLGAVIYESVPQDGNPEVASVVISQAFAIERILVTMRRHSGQLPLIVAAAGNSSDSGVSGNSFGLQSAMWSSPINYAGLVYNNPDIIVVESVDYNRARSVFSDVGGHLSAGGDCVITLMETSNNWGRRQCRQQSGSGGSLIPGRYGAASGTSFSAPYVTGVASYLLTIDPTLTNPELRSLLLSTSQPAFPHPTVGGAPANTIDAYAAALAIDVLRGDDAVLGMLLDIDDGTPDGNQRVMIGSEGFTGTADADEDGVIDGADDHPAPLVLTSTDFGEITATRVIGEDADSDERLGDGIVDMSDFRRWRDWYLGAHGLDTNLDGSGNHFKRDVNSHPEAGVSPTVNMLENVYPRGDFNGDGVLSLDARAPVPGFATDVTDLEVLQQSGLWEDRFYDAADLPALVNSGDLEIWTRDFHELPGAQLVLSYVAGDLSPDFRVHTEEEPRHVYTLPEGTYTAGIQVLDANNYVILELWKPFTVLVGGDYIWGPLATIGADIKTFITGQLKTAPGWRASSASTSWGCSSCRTRHRL